MRLERKYNSVTLSTSVLSFINRGIFSEQKRLTSLIPQWDLLSQHWYKNPQLCYSSATDFTSFFIFAVKNVSLVERLMENNCHCNESKCSLRSATTVKNFSIQENNLLVTSQQTGIVFLLAILQHIYLFTEMFQLDGWMTKRIYLSLKIIFVKLLSPLLSRKKR